MKSELYDPKTLSITKSAQRAITIEDDEFFQPKNPLKRKVSANSFSSSSEELADDEVHSPTI